jgi:hypothetical protein
MYSLFNGMYLSLTQLNFRCAFMFSNPFLRDSLFCVVPKGTFSISSDVLMYNWWSHNTECNLKYIPIIMEYWKLQSTTATTWAYAYQILHLCNSRKVSSYLRNHSYLCILQCSGGKCSVSFRFKYYDHIVLL